MTLLKLKLLLLKLKLNNNKKSDFLKITFFICIKFYKNKKKTNISLFYIFFLKKVGTSKSSQVFIVFHKEELAVDIARLVAFERVIKVGPASGAGLLGLFESLKRGYINDGETIFINMGESAGRALDFMKETAYTTEIIKDADDCEHFDREKYREKVWEPFENY